MFPVITTAEIQVDKPIDDELMGKIKNGLDDLNTRVSSPSDVPNANLQIDSDSDGVPDNMARSIYTGGSGAFDATNPYVGIQSYKFTRASGAGNGGGYLETTYLEISEYVSPLVQVALMASMAGIKVIVQARYFDHAQTYLSSEDLYSSTVNPTSWKLFPLVAIPPANAKYMKLRLTGGYTDTDVAGSVWFGAVHYDAFPKMILIPFTLSGSTSGAGWGDAASASIKLPKGFTTLSFPMVITTTNYSGNTGQARVRIGTTYSATQSMSPPDNAAYTWEATFDISISALSGTQTLYAQGSNTGNNWGGVNCTKSSNFAVATR